MVSCVPEDPLYRLFKFLGLAFNQIAGNLGQAGSCPLCGTSSLLFDGWTRLRMGADAARIRSKVSAVVWSPLGWGRLTGKIRRNQPLPETSRRRRSGSSQEPWSTRFR